MSSRHFFRIHQPNGSLTASRSKSFLVPSISRRIRRYIKHTSLCYREENFQGLKHNDQALCTIQCPTCSRCALTLSHSVTHDALLDRCKLVPRPVGDNPSVCYQPSVIYWNPPTSKSINPRLYLVVGSSTSLVKYRAFTNYN